MGFWADAAVAGVAGFGLGIGLVIGAFVARALRLYMRDEGLNGKSERPKDK